MDTTSIPPAHPTETIFGYDGEHSIAARLYQPRDFDEARGRITISRIGVGSRPLGVDYTDAKPMLRDWLDLRTQLADSRIAHKGITPQPLDSYERALRELTSRGLNAVMDGDSAGAYIRVYLEGHSALTIGDWDDTLPADPSALKGWSAVYIDLTGDPADFPSVYAERDPDPEPMARAIQRFVLTRPTWIHFEIAQLLRTSLDQTHPNKATIAPIMRGGATWIEITLGPLRAPDGTTPRLLLASHPSPDIGTRTFGSLITGWRLTAMDPYRTAQTTTLYDAADVVDLDPVEAAIQAFLDD